MKTRLFSLVSLVGTGLLPPLALLVYGTLAPGEAPSSRALAAVFGAALVSATVVLICLRRLFHALREMERRAVTDVLTGLPNRRGAEERLQACLHEWDGGGPITVALLDLDRLKRVNDRFGHGVGDQALRALGDYLAALSGPESWAARWGGDEFLIVLEGASDRDEAALRLEQMRKGVPALDLGGGRTLPLTASFGMTEAQKGEALDAILRRADRALYMEKRNGWERVPRRRRAASRVRPANQARSAQERRRGTSSTASCR